MTRDDELLAEIDTLEKTIAELCAEPQETAVVSKKTSDILLQLRAQMEYARQCVCQDKLAERDRLKHG